jgi:hypothetical protein
MEQTGTGERRAPPSRRDFAHFVRLGTRWMDLDVYGHVNNVEYYSYFDTAVACYLTEQAGLNPRTDQVVGLVVETGCTFRRSITFPATIEVGLRVTKLGMTSVLPGGRARSGSLRPLRPRLLRTRNPAPRPNPPTPPRRARAPADTTHGRPLEIDLTAAREEGHREWVARQ